MQQEHNGRTISPVVDKKQIDRKIIAVNKIQTRGSAADSETYVPVSVSTELTAQVLEENGLLKQQIVELREQLKEVEDFFSFRHESVQTMCTTFAKVNQVPEPMDLSREHPVQRELDAARQEVQILTKHKLDSEKKIKDLEHRLSNSVPLLTKEIFTPDPTDDAQVKYADLQSKICDLIRKNPTWLRNAVICMIRSRMELQAVVREFRTRTNTEPQSLKRPLDQDVTDMFGIQNQPVTKTTRKSY